jgi:hypothetical protein
VRYAYAFDPGSALMRAVGAGAFPSTLLLGPDGSVLWKGHPAALKAEQIERALVGALPLPPQAWPAGSEELQRALRDSRLAAALALAQREELREPCLQAVERVVAGRLLALASAEARGDFLSALEQASTLREALAGRPEAALAEQAELRLRGTADALRIVEAQREVRGIAAEASALPHEGDAVRLIEALQRIQERVPNTYASTQAAALMAGLRRRAAPR